MTFLDKKDPDSTVDFTIDWSEMLAESDPADTIATSEWSADAGVIVGVDSNDDTTTTVWVSGGTLGAVCQLRNRVVTAGGRTYDRTIQVTIVEL